MHFFEKVPNLFLNTLYIFTTFFIPTPKISARFFVEEKFTMYEQVIEGASYDSSSGVGRMLSQTGRSNEQLKSNTARVFLHGRDFGHYVQFIKNNAGEMIFVLGAVSLIESIPD